MADYQVDYAREYDRGRKRLLSDERIHPKTRDLWERFLDWEEYKLKRTNGLDHLDNASFKTLVAYTQRLGNVGVWFGPVAIEDATREDIKRVYDGLEDGTIKNQNGGRFKDRKSYYNKIFKSKPFAMAGKADLAREVIEFQRPHGDDEVRFVDEENFRRIVDTVRLPEHKLLLWLLFDVGENINAILELRPRDFERRLTESSGVEYRVHLRRSTLKRSRRTRSEITNFAETARYADEVLERMKVAEELKKAAGEPVEGIDERIFKFGYRNAKKLFETAVNASGAVSSPNGDKPLLKDLRSGMACYLLRSGWSTDEVKARLGHAPSSRAIDRYVTYLAIGREAPKKKLESATIEELRSRLSVFEQRDKALSRRLALMEEQYSETQATIKELLKLQTVE